MPLALFSDPMQRIAIFSYVSKTTLTHYDNEATSGVGKVAKNIITELTPAFRKENIRDIGPDSNKSDILANLKYAAANLDDGGVCLFYFHGHGDSIGGTGDNDEPMDEVLVCSDGYLIDDEIGSILQQFRSSLRFFSIIDSCSSGTVIEWNKALVNTYPEIIHVAASQDGEQAGSIPQGGLFSKRIHNILYGSAYLNHTYKTFTDHLLRTNIIPPCLIRTSENVSGKFLNTKLFN
jgi:hypothetical protein